MDKTYVVLCTDGRRVEGILQSKKGDFPIRIAKGEEVNSESGAREKCMQDLFDKKEVKHHDFRSNFVMPVKEEKKPTTHKTGKQKRLNAMMTDTQISKPVLDKERDLVKFNFSEHGTSLQGMRLDDFDDGQEFDQFKGKNTSYKDEYYTTRIHHESIPDSVKKTAHQVEHELSSKGNFGNKLDIGEDVWSR